MFDTYAQTLFNNLPALAGLNSESARRMLSRAYLAVIELRTGQTVPTSVYEVLDYLRRLADTIEFHAVLDETLPFEIRKAGAFVAAESLALLADFYEYGEPSDIPSCRLRHNGTYTRVEAAILYLIAGYDACAGGVVNKVLSRYNVKDDLSPGELGAEWCLEVLIALCKFQLNPLPEKTCNLTFGFSNSLKAIELADDTVGRLYAKLGEAVSSFLHWLAGDFNEGKAIIEEILNQLLNILKSPEDFTTPAGIGGDYGRIRHLSELLLKCFFELGQRALVHVVPIGQGFSANVYSDYLRMRACGERPGGSGRPVIWPSAEAYVKSCILGGIKHGVVSMPTGSGKSFVAELAVSQAVGLGWCLYLAPTNALAEQIRGDLRSGLKPLETEVLAFIGDQEYSVLKTNVVSEMPLNSVAVMTPEKAHLALRLCPDVFTSCQLR